jgi:hypothetical protein
MPMLPELMREHQGFGSAGWRRGRSADSVNR